MVQYNTNRVDGGSSWFLLPPGTLESCGSVDWWVVPRQKPVLERQSRPFWLESHQGFSQSLLDGGFVECFTAGLSKWQRQQKTLFSFWLFFVFNGFLVQFIKVIETVLSSDALWSYSFISCQLFPAHASAAIKLCASVKETIGRVSRDWLSPIGTAGPPAGVRENLF
jgi:hypothetical protein